MSNETLREINRLRGEMRECAAEERDARENRELAKTLLDGMGEREAALNAKIRTEAERIELTLMGMEYKRVARELARAGSERADSYAVKGNLKAIEKSVGGLKALAEKLAKDRGEE